MSAHPAAADVCRSTRRIVLRYLLALMGLAVLLGVLHYAYGRVNTGNRLWFNLDKERNLPTWFSGCVFFLLGCAALVAWYQERRQRNAGHDCFRLPELWLGVGGIGLLMSLDEITILHENLYWKEIRQFSDEQGETFKYLTQWQLPGVILLILIVGFMVLFFANRFAASRGGWWCAISGLLCWITAFLLEAVRGTMIADAGSRGTFYQIGMIMEEELEIFGALLLLSAVAFYVLDITLDLSEPRSRRLQTAARFLTRKTLVTVVVLLAVLLGGGITAVALAKRQAERGDPLSPLYRRAVQDSQ